MAQGNKSRIIIWTIVGILVVIAVVMLVTKPKGVASRPPVNAERFVKQMENRFQRLETQVSDAQSANPGAPAEQWQKVNDAVARGRQLMAGMAGLTEQKDLQAKASDAQKAYNEARKTLKDITGKDVSPDSSGGQ